MGLNRQYILLIKMLCTNGFLGVAWRRYVGLVGKFT